MPEYLVDLQIYAALWPIILFALLLALLLTALSVGRVVSRRSAGRFFVVILSFSLLGIVTGQVTGLSRVAAVGAVLPAVLSLMGGVLIYLIGTKGPRMQGFVAMAVVGFTVSLLTGVYWGSKSRFVFEQSVAAPDRLLVRNLALERNRHLVALQKLKNTAEFTAIKNKIEQQIGSEITVGTSATPADPPGE